MDRGLILKIGGTVIILASLLVSTTDFTGFIESQIIGYSLLLMGAFVLAVLLGSIIIWLFFRSYIIDFEEVFKRYGEPFIKGFLDFLLAVFLAIFSQLLLQLALLYFGMRTDGFLVFAGLFAVFLSLAPFSSLFSKPMEKAVGWAREKSGFA